MIALTWTQKRDEEDLKSISIHDFRNLDEDGSSSSFSPSSSTDYLLVIDTSSSDPIGSDATDHIFLNFSAEIERSSVTKEKFFCVKNVDRFYPLFLPGNDVFSRGSRPGSDSLL